MTSIPQRQAQELLRQRLAPRRNGLLDVFTLLRHFALITYALPVERLRPLIPHDSFILDTISIAGEQRALLSVVPFVDTDFSFPRLAPWVRRRFAQVNHRVYVRDRRTGEPCVWFLGTSLGSQSVIIPRLLWSMPWHHAAFRTDHQYDEAARRYRRWRFEGKSDWCNYRIELEDSGERARSVEGFDSREDFLLRLTHPVKGFFRRLDGKVGRYSILHPVMRGLTLGRAGRINFSLYERLGIMSAAEMEAPHSVLMIPKIPFEVHLPPYVEPDL